MSWYNPFSWFGSAGNTVRTGYQSEGPSGSNVKSVDFDSAMTVSSFWAATRILTEAISSMPIKCYRVNDDGSKIIDKQYPLWRVLAHTPNAYQTSTEFFESLMMNLVSSGNFYGEKIIFGPRISGINPLMSSQMKVKINQDKSVTYEYTDEEGITRVIPRKNIWHVKIFGNSIVGMSPIRYAARSLGVSIAADNRVEKLAENGGKPSGVLKIDKLLTDTQREALRKNMVDIAQGDSDTLKILEADMDFQQLALSPQDMQLLQSRRFQIEDVARFMGVPSVLINDTSGSTVWGSGIGQIINGFHKLNLRPYAVRIEESLKRHLIPKEDWDKYSIEFDFNALLRADRETRISANATAINSGQMTPNEARNDEGFEDKEGGNEIYLNGTLTPAGTSKEITDQDRITQLEQQNAND